MEPRRNSPRRNSPRRSPPKEFHYYGELPEETRREIALKIGREDLEQLYRSHKGAKKTLEDKHFLRRHGASTPKPHMKKWIDNSSYSMIIGYLESVEGEIDYYSHDYGRKYYQGDYQCDYQDDYQGDYQCDYQDEHQDDWIAYAAEKNNITIVSIFLKDGRLDPVGEKRISIIGAINNSNMFMLEILLSDERVVKALASKGYQGRPLLFGCLDTVTRPSKDLLGEKIIKLALEKKFYIPFKNLSLRTKSFMERCIYGGCDRTCILAMENDEDFIDYVRNTVSLIPECGPGTIKYLVENKYITYSPQIAELLCINSTVKDLEYYVENHYVDLEEKDTVEQMVSCVMSKSLRPDGVGQEFMDFILSLDIGSNNFIDCMDYVIDGVRKNDKTSCYKLVRLLQDERSDSYFGQKDLPKVVQSLVDNNFYDKELQYEAVVILKADGRMMESWGEEVSNLGENNINENISSLFTHQV